MLANLLPLALYQLSGILGVGIFALPYLFYHSNIYFSLFGLVLASFITYKVNTSYIKVITTIKTTNQLSGYAQKILGPASRHVVALNMFALSLGAILVLVQMSGKFINILFPLPYASSFFVLILIFLYLAKLKLLDFLLRYLPIFFILIPAILYFASTNQPSLPLPVQSPSFAFFGWTMFALSGFTVLPELWTKTKSFANSVQLLKQASLFGLLLAVAIYTIFIIAILKLSGQNVSQDVVYGLVNHHPFLSSLVAIFGLISVTKASLNFLEIIFDVTHFDLKLQSATSKIIACFIPLFSLLLLEFNFDKPIKLLATFSVFTSIAIIFLLRIKLGKTPFYKKIIMLFCILVFLAATIAELQ